MARTTGDPVIRELSTIPGVGKSIAADLKALGVRRVKDLRGRDPERLYLKSNEIAGTAQDRCLLYVFRCAVYFAETEGRRRDPEKLKWWNWKDGKPRR